ncbi:MAG: hypothetical protein ACK4VN_08260 [Bacteroidales bacterium]
MKKHELYLKKVQNHRNAEYVIFLTRISALLILSFSIAFLA